MNKRMKIEYTQVNFVKEPVRYAFIDTSMYGIAFQGFDSYSDGIASMKGVLAKSFTLFNQQGEDMNKACLVTVLSECLLHLSLLYRNTLIGKKLMILMQEQL